MSVPPHICLMLPSLPNHEICTLAPAWHFSPFGPYLTNFCCRLFCSMNWYTSCSWWTNLWFYWSDKGLCQIREERLQDRKVVSHQRYLALLGVWGVCPCCRAAWGLLLHNMTWCTSLIPHHIISHYYCLIHRCWVYRQICISPLISLQLHLCFPTAACLTLPG